jgi:hypothetical protein
MYGYWGIAVWPRGASVTVARAPTVARARGGVRARALLGRLLAPVSRYTTRVIAFLSGYNRTGTSLHHGQNACRFSLSRGR